MLNIMLMSLRNLPLLTGTKLVAMALLDVVTVLLEYINRSILFPNNLSYYASIMFDAFDAGIIGWGLLYIVIMYTDAGDILL